MATASHNPRSSKSSYHSENVNFFPFVIMSVAQHDNFVFSMLSVLQPWKLWYENWEWG